MSTKDNKKEFLRLAVVEQIKYADIEKKLGISQKEFSPWWEELKEERLYLTEIRNLRNRKCPHVDFDKFKDWFELRGQTCYYCSITPAEIAILEKDERMTKRNRGKKLEVERILPNEDYSNLDNLVSCCYWCNNAKTDTFTEVEFKKIGKVIGKIWKDRLAKQ